jgi:Lrp/AsnC family transcriptional regulator, leucine-responsive regulatory protein
MKRSKTGPELDQFDITLLNIVQENNQLTTEQLADNPTLSATACQRRLKRLRAEGAISADVSLISGDAAGTPVTLVVLVSLEREQRDLLDGFKRRIASYPEVTQCYYVTGNADFILVVRVATMEDYGAFTERAFFGDKNVKAFHTYASMQTVKFTTKYHLTE